MDYLIILPSIVALVMIGFSIYILKLWQEDKMSASTERKDLYDRLMSKSFEQYKDNTAIIEETPSTSVNADLVDLEEVKGELFGDNQEDN